MVQDKQTPLAMPLPTVKLMPWTGTEEQTATGKKNSAGTKLIRVPLTTVLTLQTDTLNVYKTPERINDFGTNILLQNGHRTLISCPVREQTLGK